MAQKKSIKLSQYVETSTQQVAALYAHIVDIYRRGDSVVFDFLDCESLSNSVAKNVIGKLLVKNKINRLVFYGVDQSNTELMEKIVQGIQQAFVEVYPDGLALPNSPARLVEPQVQITFDNDWAIISM